MADATATLEQAGDAAPDDATPDAPPAAPPTIEMSAEDVAAAAAAKQGKGAGKKKAKQAKGQPAGAADGPSIAAHPRAVRSIARAKGWGGLVGFLLGGYLSLPTYTLAGVGVRALIAGVACYLAVWAGGVFLWRRLVVLEIKAREQQLLSEVLAAAQGFDGARGSGQSAGAGQPRGVAGSTASSAATGAAASGPRAQGARAGG